MKNRTSFITTLFTAIIASGICILPCRAQVNSNNGTPLVSPVTPNAAALFKFIERPVGSFTGTTPIDIPLYTVSSGSLQVPISINYSNGGIRVEEMASSVGLGFSLSAGGRITRVVNGFADDGGGMLYGYPKPSQFPRANLNDHIDDVNRLETQLDLEPDIYYLSCNGLSGKFFFDETGNVHLMEQLPIKIQPVIINQYIEGWIIIDDKGTTYYLGQDKSGSVHATDNTRVSYTDMYNGTTTIPPNQPRHSGWHLLEIRDMNDKQVLRFSYASDEAIFKTLSGTFLNLSGLYNSCNYSNMMFGQVEESYVNTDTEESMLTGIVGRNDSLVFYSSARLDVTTRKIDSLRLYSRDGALLKRTHLTMAISASPAYLQASPTIYIINGSS